MALAYLWDLQTPKWHTHPHKLLKVSRKTQASCSPSVFLCYLLPEITILPSSP